MRKGQNNKLNKQSITIFNYYLTQLLPTLIPDFTPTKKSSHAQYIENRNIAYYYIGDAAYSLNDIKQDRVLKAAQEIYLSDLKTKTGEYSGIREVNCRIKMLPISAWAIDHIDIVISTQEQPHAEQKQKLDGSSQFGSRGSRKNLFCSPRNQPEKTKHFKPLDKSKEEMFELYVIHRSQQMEGTNSLEWLNFIQRYKFAREQPEDDEQKQLKIVYEAIFVHRIEGGLFSLNQAQRMLQNYFHSNCPTNRQGKSLLLQNMLIKVQSLQQLELEELRQRQKIASNHFSHRRSLRFSPLQKETMNKLLPRTEKYFKEINPNRQINSAFLEQLVCRMMENNDYNEKESWAAIMYYLDFERRMRTKYSWQDFRELREMNFFSYIGKDKMGHPVLLNRVRFTLLSKIMDKDKFFDYHFYFFQIYLQDQMEGWVDEFIVIGDASQQVNDNTDIMFTKKLLFELAKTTLGRCAQLFVSGVGLLGRIFIKIVFPLLPDSFKQKIHIYGDDKQQLLQKLREMMNENVIPTFLGGKNDQIDEGKQHKASEVGGKSSQMTESISLSQRHTFRR